MSTENWFDVTVRKALDGGRDTLLLELVCPGGDLPSYTPGAHVAVECGAGVVRHYSLSGDGKEAGVYTLGVKLAPDTRGGSRWIFDNAREGGTLRISSPRNHFPLLDGQPAYLFLSGGIGITPIVSMLHYLRARNVRARLVHMCRSPEDLVFGDWLADLGAFHDVHLHFDATAGGMFNLQRELEAASPDTAVYCCGPTPMMNAVQAFGVNAGRPDKFHFEFFASPAIVASEVVDSEFIVIQNSTGRAIPVSKTKTMLAALREAGIEMKSECEYGVCGWCSVGVLAGEPQHFDSYLTTAEQEANKMVLPCVSRCSSATITLDI